MRRHRGPAVLLLVAACAALVGLVPVPAARGSCVGPVLAVGSSVDDAAPPASGALAAPGEDLTASGLWFHTGCDDTDQGAGCAGPAPGEEAPMEDVGLVLEQDGRSWTLDTQDASSRTGGYAITWRARVPADAHQGPATLRAGDRTLPVRISG